MKHIIALTRFVAFAAVLLPLGGCGGCRVASLPVPVTTIGEIDKNEFWVKVNHKLARHAYINVHGPTILTSAVGSATPVNSFSPLSALATEAAVRTMFDGKQNERYDTSVGAILVGNFAIPNWGGVSLAFEIHQHRGHVQSLFATDEPQP